MTGRLGISIAAGALSLGALAAGASMQAPPAATGLVDIASVEMGGRVESSTSVNVAADWVPVNLIATTPYPGWSGDDPGLPIEVVFAFFNREPALVASVAINPQTPPSGRAVASAKDVEVWTSVQSPTSGFTRVATATLKDEDVEQPIPFTPVEAKFVKVRILSAQPFLSNDQPIAVPAVMRRVRIFEGQRAGYVSLLDRNADLAALAKGVIPRAPESAKGAPIPAEGPACTAPVEAEAPKKSKFPESRRVLVIANTPNDYMPGTFKPDRSEMSVHHRRNDYSIYARLNFIGITPQAATPALLLPSLQFDTVVIAYVCDIDESVSKEFKQALMAWVAAGHKLILQDSDGCGAATGARRSPDYSFLPYPFASANPGAAGAKGVAHLLEDSTLASGRIGDSSYLDIQAWVKEEDGNGQELGDANLIVKYDAHWCGAIFARNVTKKNGFLLAYARYGRGLIIYDGADRDDVGSPVYDRLVTRELAQSFDPDYLTCSQRLADFVIGTDSSLKTQSMAAGKTFSYPITVFGTNGYTGKVALSASVVPADPSISVKVEPASVSLGEMATSSLAVTTSGSTSQNSKVVALRGRDAAGKSSVLCLNLPERRSGSISVLSGLRKDRTPTKNLEIILDASGSMKALLGKKTRWATAQDVLKDVVSKLPDDFSVGLRIYGHTLPSTSPGTCTDSALVVPVAPLDRAGLLTAAAALKPRGETPLVYSILQTPDDLKPLGGGTVILITDGEESCKGDFAAAAKALKDSGLNLTLNIVGFTLKSAPAQAQLGAIAESTNGHYFSASSGDALARAVLLAAVDRLAYRILDAAGKEVAQGEAGAGMAHELPPADYKVVVTTGDESLTVPASLAVRQDLAFTIVIKDDKLSVQR